MKNILTGAAFMAALLWGAALAQSTSPSAAGGTAAQPQGQPAAPQTQPQAQTAPQTGTPSAQTPTSAPTSTNPAQPAGTPRIAPGSVIPVQLTKSIDAKKAKTGDEVVAKVTQDMKTGSGEVLVPKDTKVMGHVTEAQARTKEQKESELGIAFDRAVMKNGSEVQLPMSIQAVIGQQNNNPNTAAANDQATPSPSTGASAPSSGSSRAGMGGSTPPPTTSPAATGGDLPSNPPSSSNPNAQINAQTQGVVGISNLKLSAGTSGAQGSVVSSEKNNVKLDSGTVLLLKVSQQSGIAPTQ